MELQHQIYISIITHLPVLITSLPDPHPVPSYIYLTCQGMSITCQDSPQHVRIHQTASLTPLLLQIINEPSQSSDSNFRLHLQISLHFIKIKKKLLFTYNYKYIFNSTRSGNPTFNAGTSTPTYTPPPSDEFPMSELQLKKQVSPNRIAICCKPCSTDQTLM